MAAADDITRTVAVLAGQFALTGEARFQRLQSGLSLSEVGKATGTTAGVVAAWESCLARPSQGEALAWLSLLTDRLMARKASYTAALQGGHAGGNWNGAEATAEQVQAGLARLGKEFGDSWTVTVDGLETIEAGKPKVLWRAVHPDWGEVTETSAPLVALKMRRVQTHLKENQKRRARGMQEVGRMS